MQLFDRLTVSAAPEREMRFLDSTDSGSFLRKADRRSPNP
jgi:hypothetical protein